MTFVIRMSTRLRSTAPIPREFLPIAGLEYLGLIYQQRIITTPEEFNQLLARVSDKRFPSRGCEFFPYALTSEDEAKMNATPAPALVPDPTLPAPDDENLKTEDESTVTVDVNVDVDVNTAPDDASKFFIDGKGIFMDGKRIAGLFGDDKQLRVLAEYNDLRPEIETWLASQSPE